MTFRILAKSHADDPTLYATSTETDYDVANLQIAQPSIRWRSTSLADQEIFCNFSALKACSGFALSGHNLSVDATVQLELFREGGTVNISNAVHAAGVVTITTSIVHGMDAALDNAVYIDSIVGMTDLNGKIWTVQSIPSTTTYTVALTTAQSYTSGGTSAELVRKFNDVAEAFPPRHGWAESPYGVDGWGGFDADGDYPDYTTKWFAAVVVDWMRVTISDSTNADGYVEAGRIKIGQKWSPGVNYDWGAEINVDSETRITRTRGGSLRAEVRPDYRTLGVKFSWLTDVEVLDLLDVIKNVGRFDDVLVSAHPDEGVTLDRQTTMLARIVDHSPAGRERQGNNISIYLEEEI